jgi:hypothetical protein
MFQEEITILNIYAQHIGASNNIKKNPWDLTAQMDTDRMIVGNFKTHGHQKIGHTGNETTQK